jgi:nitrite reductase/ring-hydroxylating ferredoxin subunit/uncharacterized membrane protein
LVPEDRVLEGRGNALEQLGETHQLQRVGMTILPPRFPCGILALFVGEILSFGGHRVKLGGGIITRGAVKIIRNIPKAFCGPPFATRPMENTMAMTTTEQMEQEAIDSHEGLAKAGTKVSLALHHAVMAGGEPARKLADALHGTWLGHPLHPMLTDLTIGAWTWGTVLDGVAAATGSPSLEKSADHLMVAGTLSAIPTALTGMTDYSTFPEKSARTATYHGLLNVMNLGLYVWSIRERRRGHRGRGVFLSTVAFGVTCLSSWLGGHLVYKDRVGVNNADDFEGPETWTPVFEASQLRDRQPETVDFDGKPVLLYRDGEEIFAIGNRCAHAAGPLNEGTFHDGCVQCPWHDSVFKLADGSVVHGPATQPQPRFETRVRDGQIEIRLA